MANGTLSFSLDSNKSQSLRKMLADVGWGNKEVKNNPYIEFCITGKEGTLTRYTSGKLVFQGTDVSFIEGKIKDISSNDKIIPHLGVDEVGKGDYFGPLIVVSCYVDESIYPYLISLGVGDSKKFTDEQITKLYDKLKDKCLYYPVILHPREYNVLKEKVKNGNVLLAQQHSRVIEEGLKDLKIKNKQCDRVVIDQFAMSESCVSNQLGELGKNVELIQFHKGESDVAVACASIIARGIFIGEFSKMSQKYKMDFPKGATIVIPAGKEFVKKYGINALGDVAKLSFRTTQQVTSQYR